MSSSLNSEMFPVNCSYKNKYAFGEIEELSHVKLFVFHSDKHISLFSYSTSSNVPTHTYFSSLPGHVAILVLRLNHTPARTCYYTLEAVLLKVLQPFIPSYKTGYSVLCKLFYVGLCFAPWYSSNLIISHTFYGTPASECSPPGFFIRQAGEL